MSQRNENLARLALYRELEEIVSAMKNLAQVELHRVARIEACQQEACTTTLKAMARTAAFFPAPAASGAAASTLILLGSERGFCGGFNEQIARDAAQQADAFDHVLVIGGRLAHKVNARAGYEFLQAPTTADEVLLCAQHILDRYTRQPLPQQLRLLYHAQHGVESVTLLPMPVLPAIATVASVRLTLAPDVLWHELQSLYLQQGLILYLLLSLKAENRLRLQQMEGARDHLDELSHNLRLRLNSLRQQEIVEEIEVIFANQMETF